MKWGGGSGGTLLSTVAGRLWGTAAGRRRGASLAAFSVLALALHAVLLGGLELPGAGDVSSASERAAITVRVLAAAPVPATPDDGAVRATVRLEAAAPSAKAVGKTAASPRSQALRAPSPAVAQRPPTLAEPVPAPVPDAARAAAVVDEATLGTPSIADTEGPVSEPTRPLPSSPTGDASERELPVYRTLIPPPMSVRYAMRRGALRGTGELQWSPDGDRYEARLVGRLAGITVLTQVSQGGFDEAGVAPLRFTDQRAAGAVRAANFQREFGKITFSGPNVEHTLLVGSQDRLSWMIQLAAVVAGEPQRLQEGGKVVIHVVGARGDSRLWVFRCSGVETITVGTDSVQTVRFVRDASESYDTRVEVWLDPRRHHLPARALLHSGADGDGLELVAQEAAAVP